MAIPATKTLYEMDDVTDSDITVKVTGYMWYWHYEYIDMGVEFMSKLSNMQLVYFMTYIGNSYRHINR